MSEIIEALEAELKRHQENQWKYDEYYEGEEEGLKTALEIAKKIKEDNKQYCIF